MGKVASGFGLHKCAKREQLLEDHISQLPHEILVHILSFLTFKEAARTSVLSKCWTNLWTYSARLDFYDFSALERIGDSLAEEYKSVRERERCKFVKWVNKVLQSHKALALDEFRVHFHLKRSSQEAIDKWLQFAFSRKVQRLELDLSGHDNLGCPSPKSYAFPYGPLGTSGKSAEINPCALIDFKSLKALSLNRVNMSGEVLEFILHNCQYLERLVVCGSENLINVEVSGPPALKHLEICFCYNMKCLTICDTNLVSLKISCVDKLVLKNVPMLIDVYVRSYSRNGVRGVIARLSCCLLKLEVLTLSISSDEARKLKEMVHELPQLPKLKQLTLKVSEEDDKSLLGLTSLIRVSPNLEKLVIKMDWDDEIVRRRRRKFGEAVNYSLHHLKVFKLSGFLGCTIDVELVKYFLKNAVALEKVIIDPRWDRGPFCCPEMEWETEEGIEEENAVRRRARQQLNRLIPSHVEFVIL